MPASGRRVSAMFSLILKGVGSFLHFYVGLRAAAAVLCRAIVFLPGSGW